MTARPSPEELTAVGAPVHYTPAEAAGILDPSGKTTGYWMLKRARSGQFPCTRVGRSIVFSPGNLAEIARSLNKPSKPRTAVVPVQAQRSAARGEPAGSARRASQAKQPKSRTAPARGTA